MMKELDKDYDKALVRKYDKIMILFYGFCLTH